MRIYIVEVKEPTDRVFRPVIGQEVHFELAAAERRAQAYRAGSACLKTRFRVRAYKPAGR